MAGLTGEKRFSTDDHQPVRFERTPIPQGDYTGRLVMAKAAVGKKPEPGKQPYVKSVMFEVLDTANTEGGKNRTIYHTLFTSLKSYKNGFKLVKKADQIVGLAKALGQTYEATKFVTITDEDGSTFDCLDPNELKSWLDQYDGAVVRFHISHEATGKVVNGQKEMQHRIEYFVESENADLAATAPPDTYSESLADMTAQTLAALSGKPTNGVAKP
jgi:hypothetical protein